ncbi:TonB-dependent receptor domain-containing protein [Dinghuibacter silviterrae]|uniref:Outer membrane receptor protein involved in Fe transport n=1 Tax=Dinghuibacter silviterrae TaxID=1539049 RepID=A0A4R8DTS6_9BACT|nr:TonB-dependent receptor [Dinghuibacter silviterrae]TDX01316.1 outer membrane receptor protein involved in Fe transport [Dinghuibacter silviterrae]
MKQLFTFFVLLIGTRAAMAQDPATHLTGRIVDSVTGQPLEYATISVFRQKGAKPATGAITGNKGTFSLDGLAPGKYTLTLECIGYETKVVGPFDLADKTALGDLVLSKKVVEVQGVTIRAPGLVENKLDKLVYNVEKDVTSIGGVATDVLKKVPMVSVDIDGNVDIMGNSNILFLINGKPSSIFGNNLADALQTIPASQIKSIEVITSPGAKYDAEGTGGIINIILKDNKLKGINGNISLTGGSRLENGSFNLNARTGHFGMNAFFSGNAQLASTTLNSSTRTSYDSTGNVIGTLTQNGSSSFYRNGFESGVGAEWDINKRNTLNASLGFDNFGNHNNGPYIQGQNDTLSLVNSVSQFRAHSVDWQLSYKKTFARDEQELDISADGSEGNNKSSYTQSQSLPSGDSTFAGSQGVSTGQDHEANLRVDYTQPLTDKIKLETGGRIQLRRITSNSPVYTFDPTSHLYPYDTSQSNSLTYDRRVYAGYVSMNFPLFHWLDVKSGLRYERTETDATFSQAPGTNIPGYNTWAPSIIISHTFAGEQTLKLGYSKRIERPGYRSLNPYVNASDPKNLTRGNPFLQPEIGNNFDLTYSKSFTSGGELNVALFYRRSDHDIQPFIVYYPSFVLGDSTYTDVSVSTPENVGSENNYGVNIFGSAPITKKLNLRSNISSFYRYITTGTLGGEAIRSFNYRININATYQVAPTLVMEFFGNFNSARNEIQGRYPSFISYNFAARKQFWNKKASIAITTTNPFEKYVNQATVVSGSNFTLNSLRQVPYRSFGLNFTYKFGKLEFKKDKEQNQDNGGQDLGQ